MITYLLTPGGSGNGISDALKRMRCPRMVQYELQRQAGIGSGGQLCGTIFHAFAEIYANLDPDFDPDDVQFTIPEGAEWPFDFAVERMEATRVFHAHRKRFKPHFGGNLVATESFHKLDSYTAKMDTIIDLPEANELGLHPGRWIIDYKCLSSFGDYSTPEYMYSPQAAWYRHVYETDTNTTLAGAAFLIWTKTKVPKYHVVQSVRWSKNALEDLREKMKITPSQERTFNCSTKYGTCRFAKQCLGE